MQDLIRAAALAVAAACAFAGPAGAAPQVLALVGGDTVDLACEGGTCAADLTSFCLQPGRRSPDRGEGYRLDAGAPVRLLATAADGTTVQLDAAEHLRIQSLRTHVAVRVTLDEAALARRGLTGARIEVGDNVSLLPAAVAGDRDPLLAGEVALATGPLRELGARLVDRDPVAMAAARVTTRLINALPRQGGEPEERRAAAWQRAVGSGGDAGDPALRLAREVHDRCRTETRQGSHGSLRQCLETEHDMLVGGLNTKYWDALKTGS